jgi:putative transposase
MNALFYMTKAGCTWRMLPHDLPPWEVVYMYFSQWRDERVFERINDMLRRQVRIEAGKDEEPSAAIIDSQSVKTERSDAEKGGLGARLGMMLARKSKAGSDTSL